MSDENEDSRPTGEPDEESAANEVLKDVEKALSDRLKELGLDPTKPVSIEILQAAADTAMRDHNYSLTRIGDTAGSEAFTSAWRAYLLSSCVPVDNTRQQAALDLMLEINPAATLESAGVVLARLSFDLLPWQTDQEKEDFIPHALTPGLDFAGAEGAELQGEIELAESIFAVVRGGKTLAPLLLTIAYPVLLNRVLLMINQMMRDAITRGWDHYAAVFELADVAADSVTDHI